MIYGVISDIHGNYSALTTALQVIKHDGAEKILNCGDIVGYGPEPDECVNVVRSFPGMFSVKGNHEVAVAGVDNNFRFNPSADRSVKWTKDHLSEENACYLRSLDTIIKEKDYLLMHGTPDNPIEEYMLSVKQASRSFKVMSKRLCFVGHTHVPACFMQDSSGLVKKIDFSEERPVKLELNCRYIINPGSVGQPRDGDPRASACLYDSVEDTAVFKRVEYDVADTQRKIREAGLPAFLSYRLSSGR